MRATTKAAFFCLAGALLWFSPWLVPGRALLGTHPGRFRPYEEVIGPPLSADVARAAQPLYSDKLLQHDPEVRFSAHAGRRGSGLPAWNPMVLGGVPHLATGLSSAMYPLMWLSRAWEPPRCYAVIALVQTALAAWFAFRMLRAFDLRPAAAGAGALLFAGSGWMSVHQEYFQLTAAATWLPLSIAGAKRIVDRRGGVFDLGIAVACAFLSGFPQIAVYSLLAPALLVAGVLATRLLRRSEGAGRAAGSAGMAALAVAAGLAIASPQILATAEFVPHSTRQPLTPEIVETFALPPALLVGALLPDVVAPAKHAADVDAENERAAREGRRPRHDSIFELALAGTGRPDARNSRFETGFAIGAGALLLAGLGLCAARGAAWFFAVLLAAGLALSLPGPLLLASARVPGLDVGDPKRALLLVELALVALAAVGVEKLLADARWRRRALATLGSGAALLAAAGAAWLLGGNGLLADWAAPRIAESLALPLAAVRDALAPDWLDESRRILFTELSLAALSCLLVLGAVLRVRFEREATAHHAATTAGLLLALAAPLALSWFGSMRPVPTEGLDARPSLVMHFVQHPPAGRILRVGPRDEMPPWPPKLPMLHGVRDAQGYVAAFLQRWADLFEAVAPGSTSTVAVRPIEDPALLARPLFDALDVEFAFAALPRREGAAPGERELPPVIPGWDPEAIDPPPPPEAAYELVLWRNPDALGRARLVQRVEIVRDDPEVIAAVAAPGFLPREEAWMTAADAAPLLRDPEWAEAGAGHAARRTLLFAPVATGEESAPAAIELLGEAPDDLALRVSGPGGLLVQSDCWYPGWQVRVDGGRSELLRVDHALRGVVVPPGEHLVQFHYTPRRLIVGLFLVPAAFALLVIAASAFARRPAA